MVLKHKLIFGPLILVLILAQSYFWVPSYNDQTKGNPSRLEKFIESSIGDAKLINPILSADSASNRITDLVFDGLLALDENLQLTGKLATNWSITETAYIIAFDRPAKSWLNEIETAIDNNLLPGLDKAKFSVEAAQTVMRSIQVVSEDGKPSEVSIAVSIPPRIRIDLPTVDQDLAKKLSPIFGPQYWDRPVESIIELGTDSRPLAIESKLSSIIDVLEHNPIIEFHLRKNVTFHDGHPFDATDVKFTYDSIMDSRNLSPRTSDFEPIKTLEILNSHRLRITYKRLFSPAINAWTIGIIPEHLLNDEMMSKEMEDLGVSEQARTTFGLRDAQFNRKPIGTGAFVFENWESDELIHLIRNDNYWAPPPQYRDFFYRVIPDSLTQEVEFLAGAMDTYTPQPHQAARYIEDKSYQSHTTTGFNYSYIGYNIRRSLFQDKRIRQALSLSINVDDILKYILHDTAKRITGPYAQNTRWYNKSIEPIPYDPQRALKLFQDAGWTRNKQGWLEKNGKLFEFTLITNNGNLVRKAIMTTIQDAWKRIGVKAHTQVFEWAVFLEDFVNPGDFDAVILGWGLSPDPDLHAIWHSSQTAFGEFNFIGYDNQEVDDLILRIRQEYDSTKQQLLTHELHRIIATDQPYTFLFSSLQTRILDRKIAMKENGQVVPLRASTSGDLLYHFNRWHKLEHTSRF